MLLFTIKEEMGYFFRVQPFNYGYVCVYLSWAERSNKANHGPFLC